MRCLQPRHKNSRLHRINLELWQGRNGKEKLSGLGEENDAPGFSTCSSHVVSENDRFPENRTPLTIQGRQITVLWSAWAKKGIFVEDRTHDQKGSFKKLCAEVQGLQEGNNLKEKGLGRQRGQVRLFRGKTREKTRLSHQTIKSQKT